VAYHKENLWNPCLKRKYHDVFVCFKGYGFLKTHMMPIKLKDHRYKEPAVTAGNKIFKSVFVIPLKLRACKMTKITVIAEIIEII